MNGEAQADGQGTPPNGGESRTPAPETVRRAREMGWVPKEEFRGDTTRWVDADAYVERGEQMLPIVQANNRRLMTQVNTLQSELAQERQRNQSIEANLVELQTFTKTIRQDQVKTSRADLAKRIKAAREAGDVELELELQEEARQLTTEPPTRTEPPARTGTTPPTGGTSPPALAPEFVAWQNENPWFGAQGQERKTQYAMGVAQELRRTNPELLGKAFFDRVTEEVNSVFEPRTRQTGSRVEGGNGSSGSPGGGRADDKKTFADLPADAQSVARAQAKRFVGKDKVYKTEQEWFNFYTAKYFEKE